MKNFRTLDLALEQYHEIKKAKLKGELRSQIERAAMSVCLNLVEGNARLKTSNRHRFFNISFASQKEVQTLILMAQLVAAHLYRLQQRTL